MKNRLSDLMNRARSLEAAIGARVEGTAPTAAPSQKQPLEIVHAIVDALAAELQPSGRGQQAFPYTHVRIAILAPSPKERARLEVALEGPPPIEMRIRDRLLAAGSTSQRPAVKVTLVQAAKPHWTNPDFHLDLTRAPHGPAAPAPQAPPAAVPSMRLDVLAGTTEKESYDVCGGVTAVGRGAEVRDRDGRLLRTNHVAFVEGTSDVNQSVSRRHARIEYEPSSGAYRLLDDTGSERTSVVRDGRGLRVPHGRGLKLRTGDVIALGDARLLVVID